MYSSHARRLPHMSQHTPEWINSRQSELLTRPTGVSNQGRIVGSARYKENVKEARETEDGLRWIWMCLRFCFWCRHLVHMATGFILSLCVCVFLILSHVQIRTHTHTQTRTNAAKWKSHLSPAWKNLILTNPSKSPVKQFATFCQTFFFVLFFLSFYINTTVTVKIR